MGKIQKALLFDDQIQAVCINSTDIVNEAIRLHRLSPVCAAALGRTLSATAMMASNLKGAGDSLSITIKGGGPIGSVVTACDSALNLRGYVDYPQITLPLKANGKLDVSGAVGSSGTMTVIKDLGLKEPYVGQSRVDSGEIAEDFAVYFAYSEQQPCAVALGVLVDVDYTCKSAGGIILNVLPGCREEVIEQVQRLAEGLGDISSKFYQKTPAQFLTEYFGGYGLKLTSSADVFFNCKCSSDSIDKVIIALSQKEAEDIIKTEGKIEVKCHFCNKDYIYNKEDTDRLFGEDSISG